MTIETEDDYAIEREDSEIPKRKRQNLLIRGIKYLSGVCAAFGTGLVLPVAYVTFYQGNNPKNQEQSLINAQTIPYTRKENGCDAMEGSVGVARCRFNELKKGVEEGRLVAKIINNGDKNKVVFFSRNTDYKDPQEDPNSKRLSDIEKFKCSFNKNCDQ
ncbi:hypothetical protein COU59_01320 [Candidatus Pacearchaeota archaeon CG10_big_fil_rev_8_21_14_0_10_34_12]|nr:MAG: hypothetical protein COU59_01320 [Candidatus Pacearchaeota archaeon CG10_big_fil_rev_8_21_14_0_10_34_12]